MKCYCAIRGKYLLVASKAGGWDLRQDPPAKVDHCERCYEAEVAPYTGHPVFKDPDYFTG